MLQDPLACRQAEKHYQRGGPLRLLVPREKKKKARPGTEIRSLGGKSGQSGMCLWDNREILAVVTVTRKSRDRGTAAVLREMVLSQLERKNWG